MDNIRVNKITVSVDKKNDETKISLYKTNDLLGVLIDDDIDLPLYSESGISLNAYKSYCRDYVIELLNCRAIPGYYYEPKENGQSIKYDASLFKKSVNEYIEMTIGDKYEYNMPMTERIEVIDRYKDGYINNATAEFDVRLTQFDIKFIVIAEIKSGQLCRPRTIRFRDNEYSFNVTNVGRIIKLADN